VREAISNNLPERSPRAFGPMDSDRLAAQVPSCSQRSSRKPERNIRNRRGNCHQNNAHCGGQPILRLYKSGLIQSPAKHFLLVDGTQEHCSENAEVPTETHQTSGNDTERLNGTTLPEDLPRSAQVRKQPALMPGRCC
jgi:hypothetical protein